MENLVVVCADVGSIQRKNFGWWAAVGESGKDLSSLAEFVACELNGGRKVALGFECPLFVLVPDDEAALTRARPGEGNRPWCAGAGGGALATGLVQLPWALRAIREQLDHPVPTFLAWEPFTQAQHAALLLWEAFVSGSGKPEDCDDELDVHVADARAGVEAFLGALPDPVRANAIPVADHVYSLAGAALLRTGWASDTELLRQPCLVLKTLPRPFILPCP
ncbi:hypothetical protein [Paraburkholderia flagellata]|uniref:hypothetical protein n=1 Tax=Paraburkholderia flagellata TaxID=2883241 RepID=UPI001F43E735|nr:hypothetical protein [Paraburkholderia flagellata]